jgi:protein TonB
MLIIIICVGVPVLIRFDHEMLGTDNRMNGIRLGCFAAAFAIHGGLLATALPVNEAIDSGGGASASSMMLAIIYQPLAITDNAEADAAAVIAIDTALITEAKHPAAEQVVNKITVQQRRTAPSEEISLSVTNVKPVDADDTAAEITQVAMATQRETVGIHEVVINEPAFSELPTAPHYPNLARKRGQQGTVWIDVVVDDKGKQIGMNIFESSGVGQLDRAALAAVQDWKFLPYRINEVAVVSRLRIPVEFLLD